MDCTNPCFAPNIYIRRIETERRSEMEIKERKKEKRGKLREEGKKGGEEWKRRGIGIKYHKNYHITVQV